MTLDQRLSNLENFIHGFVNNISKKQFYTDADISGCRQTESNNSQAITDNTTSISDTEDALCELSEIVETTLADLEDAICDLSEELFTESED